MELTRRDALAALAVSGIAAGVGGSALYAGERGGNSLVPDDAVPEWIGGSGTELDDHDQETLVAVARVVYPSAVTGVGEFVTTYIEGLVAEDPSYPSGASEAIRTLDELGEEWYDGRVVDLAPETRDALLREVGVDTADPDPDGSPAERVRYYVVNELLYALYTSPTGGELVGIENPQGHPGGQASYQRGPAP